MVLVARFHGLEQAGHPSDIVLTSLGLLCFSQPLLRAATLARPGLKVRDGSLGVVSNHNSRSFLSTCVPWQTPCHSQCRSGTSP